MGNAFCLNKKVEECDSIRRLSPAPSLKKRKDVLDDDTLQEVCVDAAARAVVSGSLNLKTLSVLPLELLQRVLDQVIAKGACQRTLPTLHFELYIAGCRGCLASLALV